MTTSTVTWIDTYDTSLTSDEQLNNAQVIANILIPKGWTKEAISALCGNMHVESAINPNRWQIGYENDTSGGFGLVQWTPATKLIDWCNANGLDYTKGDAQIQRILYEVDNHIQWYATTDYPLTFTEFTQSTDNPSYLADAFIHNYERPASYSSEPTREDFAQTVYTSIDWAAAGSGSGGGGGVTPTPSHQVSPAPPNDQYEKEGTLNNMVYVQVKTGDSLSAIAKKYGVDMNAIQQVTFSAIPDKNKISVGEVLLIPKSAPPTPPPKEHTYTVKYGDSLYVIAKRLKVDMKTLAKNNNIPDPNKIFVGQVLKY